MDAGAKVFSAGWGCTTGSSAGVLGLWLSCVVGRAESESVSEDFGSFKKKSGEGNRILGC